MNNQKSVGSPKQSLSMTKSLTVREFNHVQQTKPSLVNENNRSCQISKIFVQY